MKVICINGSPHANGNTFFALSQVAQELEKQGIETEIIQIGNKAIHGCIGCGSCAKNNGKCVFDDGLNEIADKIKAADGLVVGSPVYYAGINGTLKCFLDRLFYTSSKYLRFKPAASVVALRRSGGVDAFEEINRFFQLAEMMITPSRYWNVIHGRAIGDAKQDLEGIQIMECIGKNMAYLLKMQAESTVQKPELEPKISTGFVR